MVGSMSFFVQLLEAITVLVPDFFTLGLATLTFFNLYCMAKTLDCAGTSGTDSALGGSLALGYLVTIAINILSAVQAPARARRTALVQSKSTVEQARREASSETLKAQHVRHEGAVIES
jgi:hypothetical protein